MKLPAPTSVSSPGPAAGEKPKGERPSIVVLPLSNLSGDGEQDLFVDGITEDIITELSRFRELFVISRSSSFVFKGKSVNLRDVARQLGVQFVLEGSVRKLGNRLRVTVQLIDAERDRHVWAERFDREIEDLFSIQDEVVRVHRRHARRARGGRKPRSRQEQADGEYGGLRMCAGGQDTASPPFSRGEQGGSALAGSSHSARLGLRACSCLESVRARPSLDQRLAKRSGRGLA
jgi:TolB-like protein